MLPAVTVYVDFPLERAVVRPIGAELAARGCTVVETDDLEQPSELGLFACHPNRYFDFEAGAWRRPPSERAVLVLHDLGQDGAADADYFAVDSWHTFDFGLLPGGRWADIWLRAKARGLPGPSLGMHVVGYPRADHIWRDPEAHAAAARRVRAAADPGDRIVLLLSCSWPNPAGLRDFCDAVDLDRYAALVRFPRVTNPDPGNPWYDRLRAGDDEMLETRALAECDPRLTVIDSAEDVMAVVAAADVVVSNGSGTLYDAVVAGVPGISVRSWVHPAGRYGEGTTPARIDLEGVLSVENLAALDQQVALVRSPGWRPLLEVSGTRLVEPATRGRAAALAADLVLSQ